LSRQERRCTEKSAMAGQGRYCRIGGFLSARRSVLERTG